MDKKIEPFDWSSVPHYTKDGKMIIDSAEVFEKVIRKVADETGHSWAEVMDAINNDDEYVVVDKVFDEVYERLFG